MIFSTSDSKPAYQEISDNEDVPAPKYRRHVSLWQYCSIAFLAFAWMITLGLYLQLSIATRPRPTPIPREVFTRVKTIFQPDSRYIGPSIETNHNWDHLVAGTLQVTYIQRLLFSDFMFSQGTTHFGSRTPRNGAFQEASSHRSIILTNPSHHQRASTLYLSCINYIA